MKFVEVELSKNEVEINDFAKELNISYILAKILLQRGIDSKEKFEKYKNPSLQDFRDPFLLDGMRECHDRIQKAIDNDERILLYGDYDVDGISAVTILYKFLENKVTNINYFLPNRYEDGYGLTLESSIKVIEKFHPELIITVDCGISSVAEVDYIKSQGIDIIITDHHEMQEELPKTIVVDPKVPNQRYGFDGICGAGVAMKVVETFVGRHNLDEYLPICAIATVSDIVPLVDENRAIVKLGLERQKSLPEGIKMLIKQAKIDNLTSQSISFKLAPRLNATGRMGNAYYSLDLYISKDKKVLNNSLKMVDELNTKRQQLSQQIYDECLDIIKAGRLYTQKAIIIKNNTWDSGLLGIACARLVDEFYRPIFLFSEVDGELKGSVRSIDSINIHTVLSCCNEFLETFGGHSMAAGLGLKSEHFEEFKTQIFEYLNNNTTEDLFFPIKKYDAKIKPSEVNVNFANELKLLEPVGCENPNPVFLTEYSKCYFARTQNFSAHLNIVADDTLKLIAFNSEKEMDDYQFSSKKQTLFEVQAIEYKNKTIVKGIVKKTLFNGYDNSLQNIASGRIIKEFVGKKYYGDIQYFDFREAKIILDDLLSKSRGNAIIIYNQSTFERFKNLLDLYNLNYYIGGSQSRFEENCVIFALDDLSGVINYKNLIFMDNLLETNFLGGSNSNIYAIKNQQSKIEKLFLSRDNFGVIYKAIVGAIKSKAYYANEIEFYNLVRKINPQLSKMNYSQFIASLYTFIELGMIKFNTKYQYNLYVDETVKSKLENSSLYNKLNFLSKIL